MTRTTIRWEELEEFPDYAISENGDIVNIKTGAPRRVSMNQQGVCKISLYDSGGRLVTKSVALLVANLFVRRDDRPTFDTPIHLNGDKMNCRADNLAWRPRWFAIKYHKQFRSEHFYAARAVIIDLDTEEVYETVRDACVANGLYYQDVIKSFNEETFCFPTWQNFRLLEG